MFSFLSNILLAPLSWFTSLLNASGTYSIFITIFGCFLLIRFILNPFLGGSAGSDKSKKTKSNKGDDS